MLSIFGFYFKQIQTLPPFYENYITTSNMSQLPSIRAKMNQLDISDVPAHVMPAHVSLFLKQVCLLLN